jgi:ferredoxin-NADP reductase
MPDQHRTFFAQLPFIVAGSVDEHGNPWATLLTGDPGFASSPEPTRLTVNLTPRDDDPVWRGLASDDAVGLLGIELQTRRRNRVNGTVTRTRTGLDVQVEHSYGNCPQYIQRRCVERVPSAIPSKPVWSDGLTEVARAWISKADTFYVCSYVDLPTGRQVDVSHRGGKPGFVRIGADDVLTIPDFSGNLMFNTLGNLLSNPRVGLLFVDFDTGDVLQLTGTTEIILDSPEIAAFQGAERLWTVTSTRVVLRRGALDLRARPLDASPNNALTGSWDDSAAVLVAEQQRNRWQSLRVRQIVDESDSVRSLVLEPIAGRRLAYIAGQYLPIRVQPSGEDSLLVRTYTLSSAPHDDHYRISVKRQGTVSQYLHTLSVGDTLEARGPAGSFILDSNATRPLVLLAAGIGMTPLLSMVRHVVFERERTRHARSTVVVYAARNEADRAFDAELTALAKRSDGAVQLVRTLDAPTGLRGVTHEMTDRVNGALLQRLLPIGTYDFYLCGPPGFMRSVYRDLRDLDVLDERIHMEAFGPASVVRDTPVLRQVVAEAAASDNVSVLFADAADPVIWTPAVSSLLALAEDSGLSPAFGCRSGRCGSCVMSVIKGRVTHPSNPEFPVGDDQALLCCAVPALGGGDRLVIADLPFSNP